MKRIIAWFKDRFPLSWHKGCGGSIEEIMVSAGVSVLYFEYHCTKCGKLIAVGKGQNSQSGVTVTMMEE